MLGMSLSLSMVQTQTLAQSLTTRLIQEMRATILTPRADCPRCKTEMTEEQMRAGWLTDPLDHTTACPGCGHRFVATIEAKNQRTGRTVEYSYLCPVQLFHAMETVASSFRKRRKNLNGSALKKASANTFWNMIRHHGSVRIGLAAFKAWRKAITLQTYAPVVAG
jgi:hypothetical protein